MIKQRSYPVPSGAQDAILGASATFDQIDLAATLGNDWATKVRAVENERLLASVLGDDQRLPFGIFTEVGDELVVTGLARGDDRFTASGGWEPHSNWSVAEDALVLDSDETAFVARALTEGYTHIIMKGYTPVAVIGTSMPVPGTTAPEGGAPSSDLPDGARVLAVVDDTDPNAVLDVIAIAPGPTVFRRHDGTWQEDDAFVGRLRSVKPPPVVQLDEAQLASVLPQVDEQTHGTPFTREPIKRATTASAYSARADEMAIEFALLAAPPGKALSQATPGGREPAQLRQYWAYGPGAAKIRWGTPGAWTRCHRQLTKYVGPLVAKGLCTNLGKLRGGHGVAWDVG